jgi:hypothetical protein
LIFFALAYNQSRYYHKIKNIVIALPAAVYTVFRSSVLPLSCIPSAFLPTFVPVISYLLIPLAYRLNCPEMMDIFVLVLALITVLVTTGTVGPRSCNLRVAKGVLVVLNCV